MGPRKRKESKGEDQERPRKTAKVTSQEPSQGSSNTGVHPAAERRAEGSSMGSRDSLSAAETDLRDQIEPSFGQGMYRIDPTIDLDANIPANSPLRSPETVPFFRRELPTYPLGYEAEGPSATTARVSNELGRHSYSNVPAIGLHSTLDSTSRDYYPTESIFTELSQHSDSIYPGIQPSSASINDRESPVSNRRASQTETASGGPLPLDSPLSSPGSTTAEVPPAAHGELPPVDPLTMDYAAAVHGIELSERAPVIEWPGGVKTVVPFIPDDDDESKNVLQLVSA